MAIRTGFTGTALAAMVATVAIPHTAVFAQEEERVLENVTVVAPRITEKRRTGSTLFTEVVERDAIVDITDLDLSRTADVRKLDKRIREAAQYICKELEDEYPFGRPDTPTCVRRAVEDAMNQADKAVGQALARVQ